MTEDTIHTGGFPVARRAGLIAGPALFVLLLALPAPTGLSDQGWATAAVAALMAVWWLTEAIPIPATAMLPLVLFPVLGVLDAAESSAPYANELIFLFMGGFMIAAAMERWELHKRIALAIIHAVGTSPARVVLGFMLATAFLSMWISNTATTAMLFPIGLAVAAMFKPLPGEPNNAGIAIMLGIAYGASIGGVATLIGTPPNAVFAAAASELAGVEIGFLPWMAVGLPLTIILLPLAWILLVRFLYPPGKPAGDLEALLEKERAGLGPPSKAEKLTAIVFVMTALAWVMRAPKSIGGFSIPGLQTFSPSIRDSTIAIGAALVLFLLPVNLRKGVFVLDWATARKIPWGILVLFGGGLSLARAMDQSGLAAWIGGGVASLGGVPAIVLFGAVALLFVFLTEVTSNTATSTMAMPVVAGAAFALGVAPLPMMTVAAIACSMAFMLPVATPPNAIVFGAEFVTIPRMAKAGFWLNLLAIAVISAVVPALVVRFLGTGVF
jgi:sodium-dependent dicarboxylate transporter 2/3/5